MENFIKDFLNYMAIERGSSKNTLRTYGAYLYRFGSYLKRNDISMVAVEENTLVPFLIELDLDSNSNQVIISAIKSLWRFMKREDILSNNALKNMDMPKSVFRIPTILTVDEAFKLLHTSKIYYFKKSCAKRSSAVLELLYGSGLRCSEVTNLRIHHINFWDRSIRVENGKGGRDRIVPCSPSFLDSLVHYWNERGKYTGNLAFTTSSGTPFSRGQIWKMVKMYTALAGIDKDISPHSLRHSFSTHLTQGGMPLIILQQILGHSCISTTGRYVHPELADIQRKFKECHPRYENADPPIQDPQITEFPYKDQLLYQKYHPHSEPQIFKQKPLKGTPYKRNNLAVVLLKLGLNNTRKKYRRIRPLKKNKPPGWGGYRAWSQSCSVN